jgi:hypothetical protein
MSCSWLVVPQVQSICYVYSFPATPAGLYDTKTLRGALVSKYE